MLQRLLSLILAAWAGSLWTVCAIVAPSLFAVLPDRQTAGQAAGHFFRVETWLGLALGGVTLLLLARKSQLVKSLDWMLVLSAMLGPVVSEVALRPMMDVARAAGDMSRFGMLHGVSALLFAIACVSTAILVWRLSAPPAQ